MDSSRNTESLVSNLKLSSVVPGKATGDDKVYGFTNMDLAMKLHYLRGVYCFGADAVHGLNIAQLKVPMFEWLEPYYPAAGRIRRPDDGRPFIRCNDSGVRIVEAKCSKTLDEWLASEDPSSSDHHLSFGNVLGPDLGFSPLVFLQFTWFKCGGLSLGLTWAHVLGDLFSASTFVNAWAQIMAGGELPPPSPNPTLSINGRVSPPPVSNSEPSSVKMVDLSDPDHWISTTDSKMETYSFHFTAKQLNGLLRRVFGDDADHDDIQPFEILCGLMWKSLAKVRGEKGEPRVVTVCRKGSYSKNSGILINGQLIGRVESESTSVAEAGVLELAKLLARKVVDETSLIEEYSGNVDNIIVYGACLTFVNLEDARLYDLEIKGKRPVYANYRVDGVGDEGAVLVLPAADPANGRTVTVILPDHQLEELKAEVKREWVGNIFHSKWS